MTVVVVMVSSTPCGVAVVLLVVVILAIRLQGFKGQRPCGPVACGLSRVVNLKVHKGFMVFVAGL